MSKVQRLVIVAAFLIPFAILAQQSYIAQVRVNTSGVPLNESCRHCGKEGYQVRGQEVYCLHCKQYLRPASAQEQGITQ